jgi:riboflavin kinase, archaea type
MKLRGTIQSGIGKGSFFTGLDWVVEQFREAMGFEPFPGTLNVRIMEEDLPIIDPFFLKKDFELIPDDPQFCAASLKKVEVNGVSSAAVFPSEDVHIHGKSIIEIITYCHLKETLHLDDGDQITITEASDEPSGKG